MEEATVRETIKRLTQLERHARRVNRLGTVLVVGMAAVTLMGQATSGRTAKVVEAERFVLKDSSGKPRAGIAVQASGATVFGITDQKGTSRVLLEVLADGTLPSTCTTTTASLECCSEFRRTAGPCWSSTIRTASRG